MEKKLPVESETYDILENVSTTYHPFEGTDTTSGYRSVFYNLNSEYMYANEGDVVRIDVRGDWT